jgi:hypothetical protein
MEPCEQCNIEREYAIDTCLDGVDEGAEVDRLWQAEAERRRSVAALTKAIEAEAKKMSEAD